MTKQSWVIIAIFLSLSNYQILLHGSNCQEKSLLCCCPWSLFNWCSSYDKVHNPSNEEKLIKEIHLNLSNMLIDNPAALRELYLKCQGLQFGKIYQLSDKVDEYLMQKDVTNPDGQIKHPEIILGLLLYSEDILDPRDWYLLIQIQDLKSRHKDIITILHNQDAMLNHYQTNIVLQQYNLTTNDSIITQQDIETILAECKKTRDVTFYIKDPKDFYIENIQSVIIK